MYDTTKELRSAARSILFGKIFVAILLIAIGIWATYIIITVVYMLFTDVSSIPFIGRLINYPGDVSVISTNAGGLNMSGSIVAYILALLLLSFGGKFTYKIVKLGVDLVAKLDMKFFYEKLFKEQEKEKQYIKDTLQQDDNKLLI
jgi:hypothetical protein